MFGCPAAQAIWPQVVQCWNTQIAEFNLEFHAPGPWSSAWKSCAVLKCRQRSIRQPPGSRLAPQPQSLSHVTQCAHYALTLSRNTMIVFCFSNQIKHCYWSWVKQRKEGRPSVANSAAKHREIYKVKGSEANDWTRQERRSFRNYCWSFLNIQERESWRERLKSWTKKKVQRKSSKVHLERQLHFRGICNVVIVY